MAIFPMGNNFGVGEISWGRPESDNASQDFKGG